MKDYINRFIDNFNKHEVLTLAAALAFYTALSLAPLLLITISALGLLGTESQIKLTEQIQALLGSQAAEAVQLVVDSAKDRADLSKLGGVLGILFLLFSASGVFSQLQYSLNSIWEVKANAPSGLWPWLRRRLVSMGMVLSLGFLSAVSLAVSAVLSFVFPNEGTTWDLVNQVGTVFIFTILFASIYKVLPDTFLRWREAFKGGFVTAMLFALGKQLIGLYLGQNAVGSAYGATGSLLVFLVWVYYSAMILFIGAEITNTLTPHRRLRHEKSGAPAYSR